MKTIYKHRSIEVYRADEPWNPRDADNYGIMFCSHRRYNLGDEQFDPERFNSWEEVRKYLKSIGAVIILPLYLYDHGGIIISTTPFSCSWDSGQVGFTYTTHKQIEALYGKHKLTKPFLEKIKKYMIAEVGSYDHYLTGDVYSYSLDGETDGCEFHSEEEALVDGKKEVDRIEKQEGHLFMAPVIASSIASSLNNSEESFNKVRKELEKTVKIIANERAALESLSAKETKELAKAIRDKVVAGVVFSVETDATS